MQSDDDEETQHRQARWKDNQNARPQLSGTSNGDAGSRSSALSSARVHEDESWSQHARGHDFGFRDRPDTLKAAVDAHFDCRSIASGGDASPRRRRFACLAGCSLGRCFYIGAVAGALRCSMSL